ncbi:heme oxygenase [Chryseobacterium sp. RG1]|uniref:Heme oxygenase n=1 Tax=Chryseobacterium tagetis TaxID=2801334 RepID=A0ABS8A5J8_9FLAO|nr:heme oxygenase [Chryseobacterium tagetis]MCA6067966.1 heme oxygenase [Chryseobacterium tagetis]
MKTITLYKFKDSVTLKIPFFEGQSLLSSLECFEGIQLSDAEKVIEYTIDVADDFDFENYNTIELIELCSTSDKFVEHYFVTRLNDYDVI